MNEQNEIIGKSKISNLPLKEERCSKINSNCDKKNKFQNIPIPKKIYLINKNKNIENPNNNYNKENLKKTNDFRNSSIQVKNLVKYAENAKKII